MHHRLLAVLIAVSAVAIAAEPPRSATDDAASVIGSVSSRIGAKNTVMDWNAWVAAMASGSTKPAAGATRNPDGITAIYYGSLQSTVMRLITEGTIDCQGLPIVVLSGSTEDRTNPFTGKAVKGSRLGFFYGGSPGTFVFVDADGLPIPGGILHHMLHCNDKRIVESHFGFFSSGANRRMGFGDYLTAVGSTTAVDAARKRLEQGFLGQTITPSTAVIKAKTAAGGDWNPWDHPGEIHLIMADPTGRAAFAHMTSMLVGAPQVGGKIVFVLPTGTDIAPFAKIDVPITFVFADQGDIMRLGPSPRVLMTGGLPPQGNGQGFEMWGFFPFEMLAAKFGMSVEKPGPIDPDMPIGETDAGIMPDVK